jgi:hypothetical protein
MKLDTIKGIFFICFVITAYVCTSLVIKLSFDDDATDSFNKPLFTGYTATASFSIYILKVVYDIGIKTRCKKENIIDLDIRKTEFKTALVLF